MSIKIYRRPVTSGLPAPLPKVPVIPRTFKVAPPVVNFGVIVESVTPAIVASITRDVIALLGTVNAGARIAMVSPSIEELRTLLSSALPIDFVQMKFSDCETWKGYWIHSKPAAPEGVRCNLWSRVYDPRHKRVTLKPTPNPPSLPLFDQPRVAPVGLSPNTRRMPAPPPNNAPSPVPSLYPWLG